MAQLPIQLPDGTVLNGSNSVVIVGPNGSGKSRLSRKMEALGHAVEVVSASRSTRINPQLPVMSQVQARQQHDSQRMQAKSHPWEQISDFDAILAQLLSEDGDAARAFRTTVKAGTSASAIPETALEKVDAIWQEVFEGRKLEWSNWAPTVVNDKGQVLTYSANQMSDGERAALYLAAKVMLTPSDTVLVVDEPETHFHSALAIRLWESLQRYRDDLRFVFVTHDLTFAIAQSGATFLLAEAEAGTVGRLHMLPLDESLPGDLKRDILGTASFSYYASRAVFCEGDLQSLDFQFFNAWFSGRDTVVTPVGSCDSVRACVRAMRDGALVDNLTSIGLIDRDFRPNRFFQHMDSDIIALPIHEIEGVICQPDVIAALAGHFGRELPAPLIDIIRNSIDDAAVLRVVYERWKVATLNELQDRITSKPARPWTEQSLSTHAESSLIPNEKVSKAMFEQELKTVQATAVANDVQLLLTMFPCKPIAGAVASALGETVAGLFKLVALALVASQGSPLAGLGMNLESALTVLGLPEREVKIRT